MTKRKMRSKLSIGCLEPQFNIIIITLLINYFGQMGNHYSLGPLFKHTNSHKIAWTEGWTFPYCSRLCSHLRQCPSDTRQPCSKLRWRREALLGRRRSRLCKQWLHCRSIAQDPQ
jgi:hypothetical protein